MNPRLCLAGLAVLVLISFSASARAQSIAMFPASPQAYGRAGVYTSPDNADPYAPLSNPGLLGLMAEHNRVMAAFYPVKAERDFDSGDSWVALDGYSLSSRVVYFGFSRNDISGWFHRDLPLSLGIGYHETNLETTYSVHSEIPDEYSTSNALPVSSRGFSIALGAHARGIEAGLGVNLKSLRGQDQSHASSYATDFGFYADAPSEFRLTHSSDAQSSDPRIVVTPALSYSMLNVGPLWAPNDAPPERTAKFGLSLATGLSVRHPGGSDWKLLSVEGGVEGEDLLVDYRHDKVTYQGPLGDISPINDLILASNTGITKRQGVELGLAEVAYLRLGSYELRDRFRDEPENENHMHTRGYGFRLAGIMNVLTLTESIPANQVVSFITQHLDLQYDVSTITDQARYWNGNSTLNRQLTFHGVGLFYKS